MSLRDDDAVSSISHLCKETHALFAMLTEYLLNMEDAIRLQKTEHFRRFNNMTGGEHEETFLENEELAEDAINGFFSEELRIFDGLLPKLLRYSFVVLTATVTERQIRLLGQILGGSLAEELKSVTGARKALHDSEVFQPLAPVNDPGWELLRRLAEVRNCIAHAHGYVEDMSDKQKASLKTYVTHKKDWQGMRVGADGELIPGDYEFEKRKINFCMWAHKEAGKVVTGVIAGAAKLMAEHPGK
jgi:hypothetical protein